MRRLLSVCLSVPHKLVTEEPSVIELAASPPRVGGGKGGGHVLKARGVKRRGRDRDRAAQKVLEGNDRQTDRHTICPLYDDV